MSLSFSLFETNMFDMKVIDIRKILLNCEDDRAQTKREISEKRINMWRNMKSAETTSHLFYCIGFMLKTSFGASFHCIFIPFERINSI